MEKQRPTPRHWSLLLTHLLFLDEKLAALLDLRHQSVHCWLYELHGMSCLEQVPTEAEAGKRWHLCELGLRLLAAANHLHICNMASIPEDGSDTEPLRMVQRGEALLVRHIRHTSGIYGFFASLVQAAGRQPEHELCWWETGSMCERRHQVGEY